MTMEMMIAILALSVATAALGVTLARQAAKSHFSATCEARMEIGPDGQEREAWSFSAWRAKTFIGATVGRVYVAFAEAQFNHAQRKRRENLVQN
ncbi:hypothetical protein [Limnohabitans lacus]|nr:hypothetical protein [Limnohabitans sp. HM2-2]